MEHRPASVTRDGYAARAIRAYSAMQRDFRMRNGLYRRDGRLRLPGTPAHLWPFSRALIATLDVAGIGEAVLDDFDANAAIAGNLEALERYWDDPSGGAPAYSSDVRGSRLGGDRYYDDNAWIGLALVQLERIRPGSGYLERAEQLFRFAVGGWHHGDGPNAGGVFWVEQGRGLGTRNHDRNTVSTAPNAELGLHVTELGGAPIVQQDPIGPQEMYEWVVATLDESSASDSPGTGLFWDKLRGDGSVDRTLWSYNQGSMIGANVLLARRAGPWQAEYLSRAEAIARKALQRFDPAGLRRQPPAFNAIFFRNLLLLHEASSDAELRAELMETIRGYAEYAWHEWRDRRDRFRLSRGGVTLLDQSAMVQLFALLAWDHDAYVKLA